MNTDDLRESPNLELAERFVGKGLEVRIYDPIVNPAMLVGANLEHLQSKLSHVGRLLVGPPRGRAGGCRGRPRGDVRPSRACAALQARAPAAGHRPQRSARGGRRAHRRIPGSELVSTRTRAPGERPRVAIIVQNLPVPFDRRVWLECQLAGGPGVRRHRHLPAGRGHRPVPGHRRRADPRLPRVRARRAAHGDTSSSTPGRSWPPRGSLRAARRDGPFDALQACNPPDIFWPIARWLRRRDGTRFVFDHHDLCPELYLSRFDGSTGAPYKGLLFLERADLPGRGPGHVDERVVRRHRHPLAAASPPRTSASCAPGRTRSGCGAGEPVPSLAPRSQPPRGLPRRHGPAGRRGPRPRRSGHRREPPRAPRRRVHASWGRGTATTTSFVDATSSASPRPSTSPAGSRTTSSARSCPRRTSGCAPTRSTRSTTSRR